VEPVRSPYFQTVMAGKLQIIKFFDFLDAAHIDPDLPGGVRWQGSVFKDGQKAVMEFKPVRTHGDSAESPQGAVKKPQCDQRPDDDGKRVPAFALQDGADEKPGNDCRNDSHNNVLYGERPDKKDFCFHKSVSWWSYEVGSHGAQNCPQGFPSIT